MMENKPGVLIVDDDEGMCRTLNLLLQWKGYHLATAGTGEAALALARQRFFNVALVDIRLPDMTGTDLLAQLKKLHPDLEVLLITGYATLDSAMQAVAEGAYHYLSKPLNVDVLLTAIREALEKQRLTMENRELLQEVQQELAERQRAEETLARERNLLRTLIDNLPDCIYVKDTASRFVVANTATAQLMGAATPEELLGKTDADFYPQELAAQFHADDQGIIRSGQPLIGREEPLMDLATGKAGWLSTSKVPLRDSQGEIVGIVGIGRDITERKQAYEALQESLADLERSNKELERFAYIASHDLQEPLRMVTSYVQLLARRYQGQLDDDADEFIHYAVDGVSRMQELIHALLSYSRVGTRGKPPRPTNCERIVDLTLANLQVAIEESGAMVTRDPLPTVTADSSQLLQVFQNLIGNAIKFRGHEAPRIHVGAERRGDEWLFWVGDNGMGIDPQYHERVFAVFQRLHSREEHPGAGIGLAICRRIVQRHGGRMWVESDLGKGATFYFTIPAG